ncbi:MAG: ACP S-malonyltransferase [Clostridiaceae bacterium]|nr:ACP S-malonyltransferase [Clostridiaceae bacterium]
METNQKKEKLAIIFPGQGAQYAGMGKQLYQNYEVVREVYKEADEVLGFHLRRLIDSGDMAELQKPEILQPTLITVAYSYYRLVEEQFGVIADYYAGHSLGELTALLAAGVFDFKTAIELARIRGQIMDETTTDLEGGGMLAISNISYDLLQDICLDYQEKGKPVYLSNENSYQQLVVSGLKSNLDDFTEKIKAEGGKIIPVRVTLPFHSPYMKEASVRFKEVLDEYEFSGRSEKVIANATARPYDADIAEMLSEQLISPVRWIDTINYMKDQGVLFVLEMGPSRILGRFAKDIDSDLIVQELDRPKEPYYAYQLFRENKLFNKNHLMDRLLGIAVSTKNYNYDALNYTENVVKPYRELTMLVQSLEESQQEIKEEDINKSVGLLREILEGKNCDPNERANYKRDLMAETMLSFG